MSVLVRSADDMRAVIAANNDFAGEDSVDAWYCATLAINSGVRLAFTLDDGVQWSGYVSRVGGGKIALATESFAQSAEFRHARVRGIEVVG